MTIQELQNVLPFLPNQLGALFSQVLKETLEEVLNEASSGKGGEKARKGEGWVACAKRIVGGAFVRFFSFFFFLVFLRVRD